MRHPSESRRPGRGDRTRRGADRHQGICHPQAASGSRILRPAVSSAPKSQGLFASALATSFLMSSPRIRGRQSCRRVRRARTPGSPGRRRCRGSGRGRRRPGMPATRGASAAPGIVWAPRSSRRRSGSGLRTARPCRRRRKQPGAGDLADAGAAPGRPEVEQDVLPLEVVEFQRLASERRRLDRRCDDAGPGRPGNDDCSSSRNRAASRVFGRYAPI